MEDPLTKRRRFLQGAGVSGTALLAGCSGILDSDDEDNAADPEDDITIQTDDDTDGDDTDGDDTDGDGDDDSQDDSVEHGDGDTREVGIVAEPDREELAAVREEVQSGEIEQEEATERQQEIIANAIDDLVEILQAETDIEVTEEYPDFGAIQAMGDPYELVDSLTSAKVSVLVSSETLETAQDSG